MGERAHYAIAGDSRLFYSHSGAITMFDDLSAGPRHALALVRGLRQVEHWMDDVWCEAAAVIDPARQDLLFFTWHLDGVADRAARLAGLRGAWPGWRVRWAYGGVEEVAASVGVDPLTLRSARTPVEALHPPIDEFPEEGKCVLTIRGEDGALRGYSLYHEFCEPMWAGPALLELAAALTPVPGRGVESHDDTGPEFGLHVDVARREVGFWTAVTFKGALDEVAACWPGWLVEFWEDRHEEQTRRCGEDFAMFPFDD